MATTQRDRAVYASASLALAYLRLLALSQWAEDAARRADFAARTPGTLLAFQRFWNTYGSIAAGRAVHSLGLTGALGAGPGLDKTQEALLMALVLSGVMRADQLCTTSGCGGQAALIRWLASPNGQMLGQISESSLLWSAYVRARDTNPIASIPTTLNSWAVAFVEATLANQVAEWQNELAQPAPGVAPLPAAPAPTPSAPLPAPTGPGAAPINDGASVLSNVLRRTASEVVVPLPGTLVTAVPPSSGQSTPWGWWVAGGAAALLLVGFGWGIWRRRRRR